MPEKNVALAIKREQVIKMCNDDLMDMFVLRGKPALRHCHSVFVVVLLI